MTWSTTVLLTLMGVSAALIALVAIRPQITATRGGKALAFLVLFVLPTLCVAVGYTEHIERSKQTQFCLSCHVMEPYGRSLYVDDATYLAASHFQNRRVPTDQACYTCHTDYVLYGDISAKLRGLRHLYAQYVSTPATPIRLYRPYNNRECLHCHAGARSFEEGAVHSASPETMPAMKANQLSCLSSGCHEVAHNAGGLSGATFWKEAK